MFIILMVPFLPLELIEAIISEAWHLRLPLNDRILLMTSLPLVCRSVLAAYLRISSVHVYIPKPSYARKFMHSLREDSLQLPAQSSVNGIAELCRTMTFEIVQQPPFSGAQEPPFSGAQEPYALHWTTEPPMGAALSDLLYDLRLFGDLPNFRTLTIRYVDVDLNDIFVWVRLIDFPRTVERLNLESLRTRIVAPISSLGHLPFNSWRPRLPAIRHLRVSGGSEEIVALLVSMMPNLDTVLHNK
jgi:hypothetical protein